MPKRRTKLGRKLAKIRKRIVDSGAKLMTMDEITGHGNLTLKRVTRKPRWKDKREYLALVQGRDRRFWREGSARWANLSWEAIVECYELPEVKQ